MHSAQGMTAGFFAGLDYGDAPEPLYPTLLANDGARLEIGLSIFADGFESGVTSAWSSTVP